MKGLELQGGNSQNWWFLPGEMYLPEEAVMLLACLESELL